MLQLCTIVVLLYLLHCCFVCPSLWGSSFRLHCGLMRSFTFLQEFNIQTRQVDVRFCVFVDKLPWSISGVLEILRLRSILREEDKVTKMQLTRFLFLLTWSVLYFQVTFRDSYICIERWGWRCCSCWRLLRRTLVGVGAAAFIHSAPHVFDNQSSPLKCSVLCRKSLK